jgi:hypothetical protein
VYVFVFVKPGLFWLLLDAAVLKTQACIQNAGGLIVCIAGWAIRLSMPAGQAFLGFWA